MTEQEEQNLVLAIGQGDEASLEVYADALEAAGLQPNADVLRAMLLAKRAAIMAKRVLNTALGFPDLRDWLHPLGWYGSDAMELAGATSRSGPDSPWRLIEPKPVDADGSWSYCHHLGGCKLFNNHDGPCDPEWRILPICANAVKPL